MILIDKLLRNRKLMPLFALICAFLWGCGYSVVKSGYALWNVAADDVPAKILFAGIRFLLAGAMVLGWSRLTRRDVKDAAKLPGTLVMALFQTVLQYAFLYIALAHMTGSASSVLNQLGAFLLVLLLPLSDSSERMTRSKAAGCILGFAGLILINIDGLHFSFSLEGEGCIILSSITSAIGYVINRKLAKRGFDPILLTGRQQLIGGAVLTLLGLIMGGRILPNGIGGVLIILYLAFSIAAAYVIWSVLLASNPVSDVTIYKFATPVFGVLNSAVLLGEDIFNLRTIVSLAAVAGGILLVNRKRSS
ncbi:MAG: DMT family transporter [Clostridia bacterium]|nr:DMT family transporter [Clostridia bacterium]